MKSTLDKYLEIANGGYRNPMNKGYHKDGEGRYSNQFAKMHSSDEKNVKMGYLYNIRKALYNPAARRWIEDTLGHSTEGQSQEEIAEKFASIATLEDIENFLYTFDLLSLKDAHTKIEI